MVLDLKEIVILPEKIPVPYGGLLRLFVITLQQGLRDLARKAGGKADDALMVFFKQLVIDTRLCVKTFGPRGGNDFDQILVSLLILTEQDQMVPLVIEPVHLIEPCSLRHIDLAADDRMDPLFAACLIEIHRAVHGAVIGHRKGGHSKLFRALYQRLDTAGAVKQRILGMDVQMCKFGHCSSPFNYSFWP